MKREPRTINDFLTIAKQFIVIIEQSAGNDSVGDMWLEAGTFQHQDTLRDVALWVKKGSQWKNYLSS